MEIQHLKWDSDFFGYNIGKIEVDNTNIQIDRISTSNYKLIYLFSKEKLDLKYTPIDIKRIYAKKLDSKEKNYSPNIESALYTEASKELFDLAFLSGKDSRYKLDPNIPQNKFEEMYSIWLKRSLNKEIADEVFIAKENSKITGFVTLKIDEACGSIGLIAVSANHQGKGYGKELIEACESKLKNIGKNLITVATQQHNIGACKFYESVGYKLIDTTYIYHIWNL